MAADLGLSRAALTVRAAERKGNGPEPDRLQFILPTEYFLPDSLFIFKMNEPERGRSKCVQGGGVIPVCERATNDATRDTKHRSMSNMKRLITTAAAALMVFSLGVAHADRGSRVRIDQSGWNNGAAAAQQGDRNGTVIVQGGNGQYARGVQSGYNNFLRMDQYGTRNRVETGQIGENNFAVTGQEGRNLRASTLQTGYGNVSGIAQIGTNNTAVADQDGYNNTSGIIQVGNGQDVTVRQRGDGNISVVVQSGYN